MHRPIFSPERLVRGVRLVMLCLALTAAAALSGCALFTPIPDPTDAATRLKAFPTEDLPLEAAATLRWNDFQIPYIEATTDGDAALLLGMVHAHLRLAQMELGKRLSQGRLSEALGPFAEDLDRALRALAYGRAAAEIYRAMDETTRLWLDRFVEGVNLYKSRLTERPHEVELLALNDEPWTPEDIITLSRLASTDVNWITFYSLLAIEDDAARETVRRTLLETGLAGATSLPPAPGPFSPEDVSTLLNAYGKPGSNSLALAGSRTVSGKPMLANDPHLGIILPNFWLIVGVRSPSYQVVGLAPPGMPVFAVGRNPRVAWGGTNMRALSSDLVDVASLPPEAFVTETSEIETRFWLDAPHETRWSPYGPVLTDVDVVPSAGGREVALRWMGHEPTQDLAALLAMSRAENWTQFRQALDGFAVPAQNMLYADVEGNIGLTLATILPDRPAWRKDVFILTPEQADEAWAERLNGRDLPFAYNPPEGVLVSANNRPVDSEELIGFYFPPDLRVHRLNELAAQTPKHDRESLAALQRDVLSLDAYDLTQEFLTRLDGASLDALPTDQRAVVRLLTDWDGAYTADSRAALAFEAMLVQLGPALAEAAGQQPVYDALARGAHLRGYVRTLMATLDDELVRARIREALPTAAQALEDGRVWGDAHRLELRHMLASAPLIGDRYIYGDFPVGGSQETVMKTAHDLTAQRHRTSYGSQARHISDLADMDANYFVLLGGQDGWLESANFIDQAELWREGEYIRMPLRPSSVAEAFPRVMSLTPAP